MTSLDYIIFFLILILISIKIYLDFIKKKKKDINPYFSQFNKLITILSDNRLQTLGTVEINKNKIDKNIKLGKYNFKVKLVEVQIINESGETVLSPAFHYNDHTRIIKVYIEINKDIGIIYLKGKFNNYRNLYTSNLDLGNIKSEYYNIFYTLSIKQIYIHDITKDWYGLVLQINRLVEENNKEPLENNAKLKPSVLNLINPQVDMVYDDNYHRYRTPFRSNVDDYGVIYKENADNSNRTTQIIRDFIDKDNIEKKETHTDKLVNGESQTIINL